MTANPGQDIRDRAFRFGCDVARLALAIAPRPGVRCIVDQLLKAATAVGANLEEAKASSSTREFVRFAEIPLREAREAVYWLRICMALELASERDIQRLQLEGEELGRILATIVIKTKRRLFAGSIVFVVFLWNLPF